MVYLISAVAVKYPLKQRKRKKEKKKKSPKREKLPANKPFYIHLYIILIPYFSMTLEVNRF